MFKLYNTQTRKLQDFKPISEKVGLYACGPTLYNAPHIGNLRYFVAVDAVVKSLRLFGYKVNCVMNLTDIDDKTLKGAREQGAKLKDYTKQFGEIFFEDLKKLRIDSIDKFPRATDYFAQMRELVAILYKGGFAYVADGSVYFAIGKFNGYGDFAHLDKEGLKVSARVDNDEYSKDNPGDFFLWKADPHFDAGEEGINTGNFSGEEYEITEKGRPGWHLECSVMSRELLGQPFDIHLGGVDLIFPHHQNEIAQSEAAFGKKLANYWLHCEHLLVDGKKMSKSLGNFYTLSDLEQKGASPDEFRFLALSSHYRNKLDFTQNSLLQAKESLKRLREFAFKSAEQSKQDSDKFFATAKDNFIKALEDDFNVPKALESVFSIVTEAYKNSYFGSPAQEYLSYIDQVLSIGLKVNTKGEENIIYEGEISQEIKRMVLEREKARQNSDYGLADRLRSKVNDLGYDIKDEKNKIRISKK